MDFSAHNTTFSVNAYDIGEREVLFVGNMKRMGLVLLVHAIGAGSLNVRKRRRLTGAVGWGAAISEHIQNDTKGWRLSDSKHWSNDPVQENLLFLDQNALQNGVRSRGFLVITGRIMIFEEKEKKVGAHGPENSPKWNCLSRGNKQEIMKQKLPKRLPFRDFL